MGEFEELDKLKEDVSELNKIAKKRTNKENSIRIEISKEFNEEVKSIRSDIAVISEILK